jgi:divalent metal cation (Fe/Co/Zn/Cd) transporter
MNAFEQRPNAFSARIAYRRAATLECVALAVIAAGAAVTLWAGLAIDCTALVGFAIFSTAQAIPSAVNFWRFLVDATGRDADFRRAERGTALGAGIAYAGLATYAAVNAVLDVALPRHEHDPMSTAGTAAVLGSIVLIAMLVTSHARTTANLQSRAVRASRATRASQLAVSLALVVALLFHAVLGAWWIDTVCDVFYIAVAALGIRTVRRSESGW